MKMKGILGVMAALLAVNVVHADLETTTPAADAWMWSTALPGKNLNGKMMTLTVNQGGAAFFPPRYDDPYNPSTPSYPRPTNQLYPYPTQYYLRFTRPYYDRPRYYPRTARPYPRPTQYYSRFPRQYRYRTRYYSPTTWPYPDPTRYYPRFTRPYPYPTRYYPRFTRPYPYPTRPYPYPTEYTTRSYPEPRTTAPYPYPTANTHRPRPKSTIRPTRYPTRYPTTRYPYWTTAPPTQGVSVCLRYLTDFAQQDVTTLFTLSPSNNPLKMTVNGIGVYMVSVDPYSSYRQYMKPIVRLWPDIGPDIWSRVCLTMDSSKNVVQVFSGANMSIRKIISSPYAWRGEPVVDVTGFDGQMTDLQVWNYPLRYKEIFNYMAGGFYGSYRGNVLTWSGINYSIRGNALLEDSYNQRAKARGGKKRTQGRTKGHKKSGWYVNEEMKGETRLL